MNTSMNTPTPERNQLRKALDKVAGKGVVAIGLAALALGAGIMAPWYATVSASAAPRASAVHVGIKEIPANIKSVRIVQEEEPNLPASSPASPPQSKTSQCVRVTPGAENVELPKSITVTPPVTVMAQGYWDDKCTSNLLAATVDTLTTDQKVTGVWFIGGTWRFFGARA